MAKRNRKSHYAVARGRRTGIYGTWAECQAQLDGYPGAKFKGFIELAEAQDFMVSNGVVGIGDRTNGQSLNAASSLVADDGVVDLCAKDTSDVDDTTDTPTYMYNVGSNGYKPSAKKARTNPHVGSNDEKKPEAKPEASSEPVDLCDSSSEGDAHDMYSNLNYGGVKSETGPTPTEVDTYKPAAAAAAAPNATSKSSQSQQSNTPEQEGSGLIMLNSLQKRAVDAAKRGDNVFITGPAGTGKSVVLKHILAHLKAKYKHTPECYVAVAPTGPTAISVGGQTIHSFAGCGVPETAEDFRKCWEKKHKKKWRDLDVMVVEEISMISGEFWDRLSDIVCYIRGKPSTIPFGGIQLVLCGDFLQLPPIPKQQYKIEAARKALAVMGKTNVDLHLDRGFAFQSKAWQNAKLEVVQLDQVFRQSCGSFVSVLREVRVGKVSPESLAFLERCNRPLPPNKDGIKPTVLYATNKDVSAENKMHLNKLPGENVEFVARDYAEPEEGSPGWAESNLLRSSFYKQCLAEHVLHLKIGAQVMLIKNERQEENRSERRLVNGSRGKVIGFTNTSELEEEEEEDTYFGVEDDDSDDGTSYPIVMFQGGRRKVIRPERFESRVVGLGTCVRETIPLKLAWAITMHKSQGLTLDYVKADVKGVFTQAQAYVALSRATDENGLELRHFSAKLVRADKRALAFYANPNDRFNSWNEPESMNGSSAAAAASSAPASPNENSAPVSVPSAKKGCLEGIAFVLTGEPEGYSRDRAEKLIKDCGGFVRTAVSGKTNYLVIGPKLDDGRDVTTSKKYEKAQEIMSGENKSELKIISKEGLFKLIHESD